MARVGLGVNATLLVPDKEHPYSLALRLSVGDGPLEFSVGPGEGQKPLSLRKVVTQLARMLSLEDQIGPVAEMASSWPWSKVFEIEIQPQLTVEASKDPSVALVLELYEEGKDSPGIELPGGDVSQWLTIEPDFTVYNLVVSYDKQQGIDVRALVEFKSQPATLQQIDPVGGAPAAEPPAKKELVSFPFPTPPPANQNLQIKYLGLGQRFGPQLKPISGAPLTALFDELEAKLTSNNPTTLLEALAEDYFQPDRDWFFGAHVAMRGWEVRAVLNDPALYGLEVSANEGTFSGLRIVILYQKLGSGVGVFYGELSMPTSLRTIQLGAVSLTIPSFKLWIYTNGDFKVSVGWPLGPNSIGVQVYVFTGGGGFYFAKLRSADKPGSGGKALLARGSALLAETHDYDPIIEFGIGLWFGVGRSFSAGPFSAELSLTMRGTFQGVLAWLAPSEAEPRKSSTIAERPDYHWFAATIGIVGVLEGSVDLKIVKLSVLVRIEASAGIAFETGYGTEVVVHASVHAEARLRIVFFTITVGFSTSIEQRFTISSGEPASIDGPQNSFFQGWNDWAPAGVQALEAALRENAASAAAPPAPLAAPRAPVAPATEPTEIEVGFVLQPSVTYTEGKGTVCGFAGLTVEAPPEKGSGPKTPFEELTDALATWLLDEFGGGDRKWSEVATGLKKTPVELNWHEMLTVFVAAQLRFKIHRVDLGEKDPQDREVAFLPMLEDLQLTWTGHKQPLVFAEQARTRDGYAEVVAEYFAELALGGLGPNPGAARGEAAAASEEPPSGPPLTQFIFDDYFLMLSRHLAQEMKAEEEKGAPAGVLPNAAQARNAGGIGSRYLLNGLRLPDPVSTPEHVPREELRTLTIASGYALNGQQFPVDAAESTCEGTLALRSDPGPIGKASIAFAAGSSATSSMPVCPPPPPPVPKWSGPGEALAASNATIALEAIPPATARDSWVAVRSRLPWECPGGQTPPSVVPLPPEVLAAASRRPLALRVQTGPPSSKSQALPIAPALLIPVRAHRVDRLRNRDLQSPSGPALTGGGAAPAAESPYAPCVYRLDGTDDATRAQIAAALRAGLPGGAISVLYNAPKAGYRSVKPKQVLLAKANLSTTSQPASLAAPLRLAALGEELGPTVANLEQVPAFASLLWELSVVQTGGFYLRYETAKGEGLPEEIFHTEGKLPEGEEATGDTAELTLAITCPEGAPVASWHNAFVTHLPSGYKDTLYVGLADAQGKALQTLHPSCPPGCVGFEGTWAEAHLLAADAGETLYTEEWAEQLYHQLQFKVAGELSGSPVKFDRSLWSLALSPVNREPGETEPGDLYRQVLPVYRFVHESGEEPNPYGAVGGTPQLAFRTGDVFGNVLEEGTYEGSFPLLYSDPLVGPGEWPGVRVAHRFVPAAGKGKPPRLRLGFAFDPKAVVERGEGQIEPDAVAEQAKAALERYTTAIFQLEDPRTEALLTTSIPGLLGDLGTINGQLCQLAEDISTQLAKVVAGGKAEALFSTLEWPIEPSRLSGAESDMAPLAVCLELRRPADLVYVGADGEPVEKSARSPFPVPADLGPRQLQGEEGAAPPEVGLLPYAEDFEACFEGWGGTGSLARLAARHDREDLGASAPTPPLWVVRTVAGGSADAGIAVKFKSEDVGYYSLAPLALELVNEKASVPEFEEDLKLKGEREQAFTGIDLDQWAESFLAAMDEVLSPAIGTAIALVDVTAYEELMEAKAGLAAALAKGVKSIFLAPDAEGPRRIEAAQEAFEQSLLAKLASAFTVSTIVQVPAEVTAHDEKGPLSPRLFGTVSAGGGDGKASGEGGGEVALSSPKLELADGESEPFLTFMASASDPGEAANLDLDLSWNARFLEHLIDEEMEKEKEYRYEPSEWLRFVREREDDPLDFQLGKFEVPVPSRRFPPMPVLAGQSATQVTPPARSRELKEFLNWTYGTQIDLPELEAQDVLRLEVTYNRPLKSASDSDTFAAGQPSLFEALAAFTVAWPVLRPHLQTLPENRSDPVALRAVAAFVEQATRVAGALTRHFEPTATLAAIPGERTDYYALDFGEKANGEVELFARAPGDGDKKAIVWPRLGGKSAKTAPEPATDPPEAGSWYVAKYEFDPKATAVELDWAPLDVLSLQTGTSACWRTRNADLSGKKSTLATNPAFVYKTATVAYDNPVVPVIVAEKVAPTSEGTLAQTLEQVLSPLATAGIGVSNQRLIKLWCNYVFTLFKEGDEAIRSTDAILLADQINLLPEGEEVEGGVTLKELCCELDGNCEAWYLYFRPSREEAALSMRLVLFADVQGTKLPIIQVQNLEVEVLQRWWAAGP